MKNRSPESIKRRKIYLEKVSKFTNSLDEKAKSRIINDWIKEFSSRPILDGRTETEVQLSMCMSEPDLGWEMILRVMESTDNKACLSLLGAWHIEEWLARHGALVIDRIEAKAEKSTTFKRILSCVYQNSMPPKVFERIKAAALYDDYFNK